MNSTEPSRSWTETVYLLWPPRLFLSLLILGAAHDALAAFPAVNAEDSGYQISSANSNKTI
jgi:hypothetical protein